ncbi:MAG: HAMP domain-containing sensor histidine kinase [Syntrophales bacterium]|nr:HAMP domain-containing sensor histidine kinase [Syntrophales bacterium]
MTADKSFTSEQMLELCWQELVRYYRHSSVGRRCTGIVHNMNTPLQVLSFHLELLEQKSREEMECLQQCPPEMSEKLCALYQYRRDKLQQFLQEVQNLRNQARLIVTQGVHEENQERQQLDLNQLYQEELELYRAHSFFKHQVEKNFNFAGGLPPIYGHYIDFSQSFRNLVDNALEAMEGAELRRLTVETAMENSCRVLRVGDTGEGVSPEIRPRLFEPFITSKADRQPPHAGLGLFMVQRLLSPYQGEIRVESKPGETWVTVVLPVE